MMAIIQFVLAAVLWCVLLGWAIHLWSVLDAAMWKPKNLNRQRCDAAPGLLSDHRYREPRRLP